MGFAVERQHVVLAEGIEVDVLDDDHLVVVLVELGRVEHSHRVHGVTAGEGEHGLGNALGCLEQTFALGIFAQQLEDAVVVLLEFFDGFGIECFHKRILYDYNSSPWLCTATEKGCEARGLERSDSGLVSYEDGRTDNADRFRDARTTHTTQESLRLLIGLEIAKTAYPTRSVERNIGRKPWECLACACLHFFGVGITLGARSCINLDAEARDALGRRLTWF